MFKEIVIELQKCTLVLRENEIWQLPPEILKKAISRGKALKRCERVKRYEAKSQLYPNNGDVYGDKADNVQSAETIDLTKRLTWLINQWKAMLPDKSKSEEASGLWDEIREIQTKLNSLHLIKKLSDCYEKNKRRTSQC